MSPTRPALVLYARVPLRGAVKTRMNPLLDADEALALHVALVEDSVRLLHRAAEAADAAPFIAFSEPWNPATDASPAVVARAVSGASLLPQRGTDLGERLRNSCSELFARDQRPVTIFGSDSPTLPIDRFGDTAAALQGGADLVIGPTDDGGYYLIGLGRELPELFDGIPWGTERVFEATAATAARLRLRVKVLPPWYDIDRPEDLLRLEGECAGRASPIAASSAAFVNHLARAGRLDNLRRRG